MPPLYQQRTELIAENTELTLRWLALLTPKGQRNVIESMVRNYTLPQLKRMREHVTEQVARAEARPEDVYTCEHPSQPIGGLYCELCQRRVGAEAKAQNA
jgi:hypothetical protein